jgi:hypothetical protein
VKRIGIITREHFLKTGSDRFLIDLLTSHSETHVLRRTEDGDTLDHSSMISFRPDAMIYFAKPPSLSRHLFSIPARQKVFVPMFDGFTNTYVARSRLKRWFLKLARVKFISFSKAIHDMVRHWGMHSVHCRYFPDAQVRRDKSYTSSSPYRIFLWQRCADISPARIVQLLGPAQIKEIVWKPEQAFAKDPASRQIPNLRIIDHWLQTDELADELAQADFIVAPRKEEGIGMSFLHGLAAGTPVIAFDSSTMNEYVIDGVNGHLFDDSTQVIKLTPPIALAEGVRQLNENYRGRWIRDRKRKILSPLLGESELAGL